MMRTGVSRSGAVSPGGYIPVVVEQDDEKMMELDGLMNGPIWLQPDTETD